MSRAKTAILVFLFTVSLSIIPCYAGTVSSSAIGGNTFACYFYTPFSDFIESQVAFDTLGGISMDAWDGNGFYISFVSLFLGFYWAVDAVTLTIDGTPVPEGPKDLVLVITGISMGRFIAGAGVMILDYEVLYPTGFLGMQAFQES